MRNIHAHFSAACRKAYGLANRSVILEDDKPHPATKHEHRFILARVEVTVRRDIGAGLDGVEQAV